MKKNQEQNASKKRFKTSYETPIEKGVTFTKPSKTQQQFKHENNPYSVIDRVTRGLPTSLNQKHPQYLDVSEVNPTTHIEKIQNLKNEIDDKQKKHQNMQKEKNDENAENAKNAKNTESEPVPKKDNI